MKVDLATLLRPHLLKLKPYTSARDEYSGSEGVFLDANENPFGSITEVDHNRYPDPYQSALKVEIAKIKGCEPAQIFLGNGSDEAIDLLFRAFCNPGKDNVILLPPTYGMYGVSASINHVEIRNVDLTPDFLLREPSSRVALANAYALYTLQRSSRIISHCSRRTGPCVEGSHASDVLIRRRRREALQHRRFPAQESLHVNRDKRATLLLRPCEEPMQSVSVGFLRRHRRLLPVYHPLQVAPPRLEQSISRLREEHCFETLCVRLQRD